MNPSIDNEEARHSRAVKEMFAGIAGKYDTLNHLLSLNIDKRWRAKVRRELSEILQNDNAQVLDVACGTGDLAFELARGSKATVIGTDFCRPMLSLAFSKNDAGSHGVTFIESDAMSLPIADASFDSASIAFGLRNLPNVEKGLKELFRILKPGGKLVILEFSSPVLPGFRQLFNFYFSTILPRIGGVVSGSRGAYEYLPASVRRFPDQKDLMEMMANEGFADVGYQNLTGGVAAIHTGTRPF